jgi:hypothetical protein
VKSEIKKMTILGLTFKITQEHRDKIVSKNFHDERALHIKVPFYIIEYAGSEHEKDYEVQHFLRMMGVDKYKVELEPYTIPKERRKDFYDIGINLGGWHYLPQIINFIKEDIKVLRDAYHARGQLSFQWNFKG